MESRKEILAKAYKDCISEMYSKAKPPLDINKLIEEHDPATGPIDTDDDPIFNRHYLPEKVFTEIEESYMDAYGIKSNWHDYVDTVKEYLEKGGPFNEYDDNGDKKLSMTKPLSELIGENNANIVFDIIEKCRSFYRFNKDESDFRFSVCLGTSPTSNKEKVIEYWRDHGVDIQIDDSEWDEPEEDWDEEDIDQSDN